MEAAQATVFGAIFATIVVIVVTIFVIIDVINCYEDRFNKDRGAKEQKKKKKRRRRLLPSNSVAPAEFLNDPSGVVGPFPDETGRAELPRYGQTFHHRPTFGLSHSVQPPDPRRRDNELLAPPAFTGTAEGSLPPVGSAPASSSHPPRRGREPLPYGHSSPSTDRSMVSGSDHRSADPDLLDLLATSQTVRSWCRFINDIERR